MLLNFVWICDIIGNLFKNKTWSKKLFANSMQKIVHKMKWILNIQFLSKFKN